MYLLINLTKFNKKDRKIGRSDELVRKVIQTRTQERMKSRFESIN